MTKERSLVEIQKEVTTQLANPETLRVLVATTFRGLTPEVAKQAIVEGMIRGFEFKDFLEKNVYAIPFKYGYSLVTSIDHNRKIGMRSGIVGVNEPVYAEEKEGEKDLGLSCTITVKKKFADGYVGDFVAKVYLQEYYRPGRDGYPSLWDTKPRTMIAKVAEMHALRRACPEELAQSYVEEEMDREEKAVIVIDIPAYRAKLEAAATLDDLKEAWASLPPEAKTALEQVKEELKRTKFAIVQEQAPVAKPAAKPAPKLAAKPAAPKVEHNPAEEPAYEGN